MRSAFPHSISLFSSGSGQRGAVPPPRPFSFLRRPAGDPVSGAVRLRAGRLLRPRAHGLCMQARLPRHRHQKLLQRYVTNILGPKMMLVRGVVEFVPAVPYHFCLNLPAVACLSLRFGCEGLMLNQDMQPVVLDPV